MAISLRAVGSWATNTSTSQTVTLPTHQAGDMLIVRAIRKPYTSPTSLVCNTSGWAAAFTGYANGSTANGTGVGSMAVCVFYKEATSSSETNPVVTWGTTAAPGACVALSYQKDDADSWVTPTGAAGLNSTAATTINDTLGTHISVTTGDMVDVMGGWCDDSGTPASVSISQPGVTYTVTSDIPATALDTSTSNDLAADGAHALATAGTSSGAATITASFGSSEEHICCMTRLRVNIGVSLPLLDGSAAIYDPTVALIGGATDVTLPLLDGSAAIYAPTVNVETEVTLPLLDAIGADYAAEVLADDPIAYWRLDEPSGTTANDEIGTADGTYANTPTQGVTGLITGTNRAVTLSAASYEHIYVSTGIPAGGADGAALECWVSFATLTTDLYYNLIAWGPSSTGTGHMSLTYRHGATAKRLYSEFTDGTTKWALYVAWTPSTGTTYHVLASHDYAAETIAVYINGSLQGTMDVSAAAAPLTEPANNPTYIGSSTATVQCLDGTIDEVAIYDHTVSSTRAAAHHTTGTATTGDRIFAITVTQTAPTVTLPLIDGGAAIYEPTVTPPPFSMTLPLLDGGATIYAPTVLAKLSLTLPLLDGGATLYAPTVLATLGVSLPLLDGGATIYAPTVTPKLSLALPLLDGGAAIYSPTVLAALGMTLPLLDGQAAIYDPTLNVETDVALPLLDGGAAIYAPSVALAGGVQAVSLPLLDGGATIYDLTVTPPPVSLTVPLIDGAAAIYSPTVNVETDVALPLLDGLAAIYSPTLLAILGLSVPLLDGGATLYSPTVLATLTVNLDLLDGVATLYSPTLLPKNTVSLELVDAGAGVYAVTVVQGPATISLDLLDAGRDIYAVTVTPPPFSLTVPLLDGLAAIYEPTVEGQPPFNIAVPLLDGLAAIYAPIIANVLATLTGYTRNQYGAIIPNCTVWAFNSTTNAYIGTTTSDAMGHYLIGVPAATPCFLVAYSAAGVYGTTARDLVGT
jgi:hypothetical protein